MARVLTVVIMNTGKRGQEHYELEGRDLPVMGLVWPIRWTRWLLLDQHDTVNFWNEFVTVP